MRLLFILFSMLVAEVAHATGIDQASFEKHLQGAREWVKQQKDVILTRSHYGPRFHKNLSVIRDAEGSVYIDYYWTMGSDRWRLTEQKYPYNFSDIHVRYDVAESRYRLIHYRAIGEQNKESKQAGAGKPATRAESDSEGGGDKTQIDSEGRSR